MQRADEAAKAAPATDDDVLFKAIKTQCVRCHGPTKQEGKLSFLASDGVTLADLPEVTWLRAYHRVSLPTDDPRFMPRGGKPVDDAALDAFSRRVK